MLRAGTFPPESFILAFIAEVSVGGSGERWVRRSVSSQCTPASDEPAGLRWRPGCCLFSSQ